MQCTSGSGQLAAEVKIFDEINAIFIKLHISVRNTFYHQVIYITQYILLVEQDILNQSKRSAPLHAFVVTVGTDTSAPGGLFINVAYARNLSYDFRKPYERDRTLFTKAFARTNCVNLVVNIRTHITCRTIYEKFVCSQ